MFDEAMEPVAQPAVPATQSEPETAEKTYTLRSAKAELRRLTKARESKKQTIKRLQDEVRELNPEIKKMTALVESLMQEDMQRKILAAFSKKMSQEQVSRALDLIQRLNGDLDTVGVDKIAEIVHIAAEDARGKELSETAPSSTTVPMVDTNINIVDTE